MSLPLTDHSRGSDGASQRSYLALSDGSFRYERRSVSAFSHLAPSDKNSTRLPSANLQTSQDPASSQLSSLPRSFRPSSSDVSSRSERQSVLAFHALPPLTEHSGGSDGAFLRDTLESFAKAAARLPSATRLDAYSAPLRRFIRCERRSVPAFSRCVPLDDIPEQAREGTRPELGARPT